MKASRTKKPARNSARPIRAALEADPDRAALAARFPEQNSNPVMGVSADGCVFYCNPASQTNPDWKCREGEMLPEPVRFHVRRAVAARRKEEHDVPLGGRIYSVWIVPFHADSCANVYAYDITERKRIEEALRESREDLNRAQAVARAGSWRMDVRQNVLTWSDENHRIFDVPKGTPMTYETFLDTIHPDDRAFVEEQWSAALRGAPYDIEHRIMVGDTVKWVREKAYLEFDEAGALQGGFGITQDITERKLVEQALAVSEERYRTLFSNMSEGFALHEILCDANGHPVDYRFLEVNPAFERLTGITRERVIGKRVLEVLPGTEKEWIERYGHVALTGEPAHIENFSAEINRWFEVYAYRPAERQFAVIFMDVTEAKRARAREQEARATAAAAQTAIDTIEAMGEGVLLMDMTGRIQSANPALERMSGFLESELAGRALEDMVQDVVAAEDRPAVCEDLHKLLRGETPAPTFLTLVSKQGTRIPVIAATSFIRTAQGKPAGIVLTLRDITELRAAYQAVEESERRYRELVETANSIIMRITPEHDILFFNEYGGKFFGYREGEVLGRNVIGTIVPPLDSDGHDMQAMLQAITEDPEAHAINENENICKDGRRVWVHWSNRAVRDEQGRVTEILCVGTDITKRKRLEADQMRYRQQLQRLSERLASVEENERRRISTQIHDTVIQTLSLSVIRMAALRKGLADAGFADYGTDVNAIRGMLEEAITESRALMAELTPPLLYELGLGPAIQHMVEQLQKKHETAILLRDSGQAKPVDKAIDGFLFRAIRELTFNALKHAGPCSITINLSWQEDRLQICVEDNGRGFEAPADHRFVFHQQGGFGLFTIAERVKSAGGRFAVSSRPGEGTRAILSVPLCAVAQADQEGL
jgi:PAS domain S-box-containing protein